MKFKNTVVFAALLAMGVSAFAADEIKDATKEKDHGIRVTFGVVPGITDEEYAGDSYDLDDEGGGQLEILYAARNWKDTSNLCFAWGAGVFFAANSGSEPVLGWDYDISAFGIMGQAGGAYRIGDHVVLEAMPYLGLGGANVEVTSFTDGGAFYYIYGIKGGVFVLLGERVELGVEAGYHGFGADFEGEDIIGTFDWSLGGGGLRAAGVVAIKF